MKTIILRALLIVSIVSCSTKSDTKRTSDKFDNSSGQEVVTTDFCSEYDLTKFLRTYEDYGTDGVFDTIYQRIQFHFETIKKDEAENCKYLIYGADRLRGLVTPFNGKISINKVVKNAGDLYNPEIPSDEKMIDFYGNFEFREDEKVSGSGVFKGDISFSLTLNKENELIDDMGDYMGDGFSNFTYEGTWTNYKTGKIKKCVWGQGRLPNTGDFDGGAGEVIADEKYRQNGWERDNNFALIDNPKNWWTIVLKFE
jgi:hypothetical protein